ncbi:MAG: endonuclease/exonuclease/phosphatase family protein [Gammaproteobacteria bacterium]
MTLRVATYNIHKGVVRDLFGLRRVPRIHELRARLHDLQADLVFLQEVQGRHERNAQRFEHWPVEPQDQFLARSPTLKHSFEVAYGQNATYLHGHHGNALLSRFPIVGLENRDVSDHALEKRGILHCVVTLQGRQAHCFVVHFGLLARSRERQAQVLIDWIDREVATDAPLIIAGDFNDWRNQLSERFAERLGVQEVFDVARPRGVTERVAHFVRDRQQPAGQGAQAGIARLPRMVRTARTYPALVPWLRMDRIYTRGFRISAAKVLRGPEWAQLSDHSPLVADLSLRP